jgi:hypothetical protein
MPKTLILIFAILCSANLLAQPSTIATPPQQPDPENAAATAPAATSKAASVIYKNETYRFEFVLPASWRGYFVRNCRRFRLNPR